MKRTFAFALLVAAFASSACSTLAVAAATVNGRKITENEVESELDALRDDPIFGESLRRDPDARGQRRRQILNELIYQAIADEEARKLRISVTDAQAARLIRQTARSNGVTEEEFLESQNLTREEAMRLALRGVRRFALIDKVVRDVDVDANAVREVYEGQRDRFVEVRLERITVGDEEDARAILEDLDGGAEFTDLARERSKDALARKGGDMGSVPLTSLEVQVQGAIGPLVEGGVSDPVPGPGGVEIYRLVERKTKSFDEVEGEIRRALGQDERDQRYEQWLAGRVRAAKIVVNPKYGRFDRSSPQPVVVAATGDIPD